MNKRFLMLSLFSWVLRIVGWLAFIAGVISAAIQGIALARCLPGCEFNIVWSLLNVGMLVAGALVVTFGEIIGVLFSIENNTSKLVELYERGNPSIAKQA